MSSIKQAQCPPARGAARVARDCRARRLAPRSSSLGSYGGGPCPDFDSVLCGSAASSRRQMVVETRGDEQSCFEDALQRPSTGASSLVPLVARRRSTKKSVHQRNLRDGQGRRRADRSYEAREKPENHSDCGSPWLALSVSTHAASHHEVRLVQLRFDFCMIEAKPQNLSAIAPTTATRSIKNCAHGALR